MIEVYSGSRPGRPGLLLACSGLTLLAALGLAGLQVSDTRRLGEPVRISGTPLIVRPPHGWQVDPKDPAAFVRTVPVERWGRRAAVVERRVRFRYQRWQTFNPTAVLLERRNFMDAYAHQGGGRAARIGPLDGVQIVRARQFDLWGSPQAGSMVYRLAMSPRGEEINVEYIPLGEMAPGDVDLLDEICAHVEIDDPLLARDAEQTRAQAQVQFNPQPHWRLFPADLPEVQGLYVQGDQGGIPIWAVGLFRTWISSGRTPEQVLFSFAEAIWGMEREDVHVDASGGAGGTVFALAPNAPPAETPNLQFPRLVVRDAQHAALLFAISDPRFEREAAAAVDAIASGLTFEPPPMTPDVPAAEAAGRDLAAALQQSGDLQWTGPEESLFYSETIQPPFWRHAPRVISDRRERASGGWRGQRDYHKLAPDGRRIDLERKEEWFFSDDGRSFVLQVEESDPQGRPTISEQRAPGADEVVRTTGDPDPRTLALPVGPAFVAGPAEGLVEARIARHGESDAVIELSNLVCRSTHFRLLRRLPPHALGYGRVLLLDDYFPRGVVVWYDADGRMVGQEDPGRRLERADMQAIRALLESWRIRQ